MKFLLALTVLASTTAFANVENRNWIKCYEPAQQGERGDVVYKMKAFEHKLKLVHPFEQWLKFNEETDCLEKPHYDPGTSTLDGYSLRLCETQGQTIDGLVPLEAHVGQDEETVYCEREILDYFEEYTRM